MAIDVTCVCGREFAVTNESAGQTVKCPDCGNRVRVSAELTTTKLNGESDSCQEKTIAGDGAESVFPKSAVSLGVTWTNCGLLIGAMAMIGLSIISAWFRAAVPSLTPLIYGLFGMAIIAPVLTIVGKLLCLTASSQMPGKGSLVLALVFDGIAFLIALVRHGGYYTISHLIGAAGSVCFLVFLKKLGESLKLERLAERTTAVLYLGNMYIALWIVQFGLANGFMFKQVPLIVVTIGMNLLDYLLFVIGLVGAASYAGLLSKYRRALSNR